MEAHDAVCCGRPVAARRHAIGRGDWRSVVPCVNAVGNAVVPRARGSGLIWCSGQELGNVSRGPFSLRLRFLQHTYLVVAVRSHLLELLGPDVKLLRLRSQPVLQLLRHHLPVHIVCWPDVFATVGCWRWAVARASSRSAHHLAALVVGFADGRESVRRLIAQDDHCERAKRNLGDSESWWRRT
jgi:hypothetical protein